MTLVAVAAVGGLLLIGCGSRTTTVTPTPTKTSLPVVTSSPTLQPTATFTATPPPAASPTLRPPTSTPIPQATPTPTGEPESPTAAPEPPTPPPPTATATEVTRPPLAPQQGGEWDMEAGFVPGVSPLGEVCPGWTVAVGWRGFVAPGTPASSCLNENKNMANVRSGQRSQEMTFDFISAQAGIFRQAQTIPGHRYGIEVWGKHVRTQSSVELSLGVDLGGGEDWRAASVTWYPWGETGDDIWVHTQVTVRASGETVIVFLKGYHPSAVQGGATLFDDVSVRDLGS